MISVIGGSGFIGTRLCRRLRDSGIDFDIIDIAVQEEFYDKTARVDVRDEKELQEAIRGDVIINLAAVHRDDVRPISLYDEVNVDGARNVCAAARAKGINKIVFASSVAVYGFAPPNTDETGEVHPFNHYGRTKLEAERVYLEWQKEASASRMLALIRPTVVFGEGNRGNVYNLLKQLASGRFVMVGRGLNRKSMAYVENVAAFIQYAIEFPAGVHLHNYVDKPDFSMSDLVSEVRESLGVHKSEPFRIPIWLGLCLGYGADFVARITHTRLPISAVRVKKFVSTTQFDSCTPRHGFTPPFGLHEGLQRTLTHEFSDSDVKIDA